MFIHTFHSGILLLLKIYGDVIMSQKIRTMNQTMIEKWYGVKGSCMLSTRQPFEELMQSCNLELLESLPFGGTLTPFSFYRDNKPFGHCCTSDLPLIERGFADVIEGYEDPNRLTLYRLLSYLLETKRALVFIGDSSTAQMFAALVHESRREGQRQDIGQILPFADIETWGFDRFYDFYDFRWVNDIYVWHPPTFLNATGQVVFLYCIRLGVFGHSERTYNRKGIYWSDDPIEDIKAMFEQMIHWHGSLLVVGNIGLHLGYPSRIKTLDALTERLHEFLEWFQQLIGYGEEHGRPLNGSLQNLSSQGYIKQTIVVWRELTPVQFDSSDGSYERWDHQVPAREHQNDWNVGVSYYCHSLPKPITNRIENQIVGSILRSWTGWKVEILRTHHYLAPFYRMKTGSCESMEKSGNDVDCLHYCGFNPPMWVPVWDALADIIIRKDAGTHDDQSKIENVTIAKEPLLNNKEQLFLSVGDTNHDTAYYFFSRGLVKRIPDIATYDALKRITGHKISSLQVTDFDIATRMVAGSVFPPFGSFKNGTLIKRDNDDMYYIYVDERRQIVDGKYASSDHLQLLYASEMNLIPVV